MPKIFAALIFALASAMSLLALPVSAQNTNQSVKSKPASSRPSPSAADVTASLQAQAIAEAAALPANTSKTTLMVAPIAAPLSPVLAAPQSTVATTPSMPSEMGQDELAIAEKIHQGVLPCELGASVRVEADAAKPGYFNVLGKGFKFRMHPVRTSTGALRLEDKKAGAVWLQLANKSMLMDQKKGRRLVDECAHPEQMAFAEGMKTNPPPRLIDVTGTGR